MLHNDIDLFRDTIVKVAQENGINDSLDYEEAIKVLQKIVDSKMFI